MKTKQELRNLAKQKILEIDNRESKSKLIFHKLLNLETIQKAKSVLIYSPTIYEVDITELMKRLLSFGKDVYLPFINKSAIGLIKNDSDLVLNKKFKILEPKLVSKNVPEVAVVPGLAFDSANYRLGYGKGWYDSFFEANSRIYKIGICFSESLIDKLPHESHDVQMDMVITQ